MKTIHLLNILRFSAIALAVTLSLPWSTCHAQPQTATPPAAEGSQSKTSAPPVAERVGATATEVTRTIQDTGQSALNQIETLWKRIDERRLKNRTPDELVAWGLMGLLVGGLLFRVTKLGQVPTILLGLIGAFLGGIVANVFQLDFGMGPVLVRYEDLICSLVGGFAVLYGWGWVKPRLMKKPEPAPAKKSPEK